MPKYKICKNCGANLDPGEICDCQKPESTADDTCVCCGKYVPEGRQICTACENSVKELSTKIKDSPDFLTYFSRDNIMPPDAVKIGIDLASGKDMTITPKYFGTTARQIITDELQPNSDK